MKSVLALILSVMLAACGTSNQRAASDVGEQAEVAPVVGDLAGLSSEPADTTESTIDAGTSGTMETVNASGEETTTATEPVAASTTTTTPGVDLDLSELDDLIVELDGLLGPLGSAMNQIEGEFTP
ncbi:MAG: hypothetical protein OEX97_07165 [Acidimicrobiia bacterium]|nr:hypothetical protein [Acidimicrobiia bacterium]